jgi:cytochrome b561
MIDHFSLGLTHGLMLLMAWRLLSRVDLDREDPPKHDEQSSSWGNKK